MAAEACGTGTASNTEGTDMSETTNLPDHTDVAQRVAAIMGPSSAASHALAAKAEAERDGFSVRLVNAGGAWVLHQRRREARNGV